MLNKDFIKHEWEYDFFIEKVERIIKVRFSKEYLKQGKVRVFKNKKGQIVGGYILITDGPFRTLASIPEQSSIDNIQQEKIIEVTGLWIDPSYKSGIETAKFWFTFSRDLSSFKSKKYFVYAYDLNKKGLSRLYKLAKPTVIFQGETLFLEGMHRPCLESIEMASCRTIKYLPLYGALSFAERILPKRTYGLSQLPKFNFLKKQQSYLDE